MSEDISSSQTYPAAIVEAEVQEHPVDLLQLQLAKSPLEHSLHKQEKSVPSSNTLSGHPQAGILIYGWI